MCYNRAGHKKFKKKSQLKFFLKDFLLECRSKLSRTKYLGYVLAVGRQKNEEVQLKALPADSLRFRAQPLWIEVSWHLAMFCFSKSKLLSAPFLWVKSYSANNTLCFYSWYLAD